MGNQTRIDWADSTWNPVTGCLHGCEYCYARRIAERFAGCDKASTFSVNCQATWKRVNSESNREDAIFEVYEKCPPINIRFDAKTQEEIHTIAPYPFGFQPTLRRDKLEEPASWKKPRTIFVCSMADLFGEWVPEEWIKQVFDACEAAQQHRYLFLTKNPKRYINLIKNGVIKADKPNFWLGSTTTNPEMEYFWHSKVNTFVSIEPILEPFTGIVDEGVNPESGTNWIIVGAETGNRKNKVVPKKEWVMELVECARLTNTPIFMKGSLRTIMGEDFCQEFPWSPI